MTVVWSKLQRVTVKCSGRRRWYWECGIPFPIQVFSPGTSPGQTPVKAQEPATCRRGSRGAAPGSSDALRPAGVLEVVARACRRGGGRGGLGARRAVTAARRGGAKRPPAESHGERPRRGARISAPVHSSAPARRPGAHQAAAPACPRASDGRAQRVRRPGRGAARGRAAQEGARGTRSAPTSPAPQNPGPRARERRVGGRAAERGGGAPAEPAACAPVPPGRLLWREPEPPGGRDWAEDNEKEAARRADRLGSSAPEAPGIAPATGPRSVRLSRVPRKEPLPLCQTSWGLSARLPQTPAAGPPMAVGTSP
ncbi:skin secretory protein xP2-like [Cervus canadensis]|uniref:skin secretory protein xP2-like n=1 Tax=Cervus canadensis TaxID=1574408 RepID=UPI001CA34625|nr:skin secretory protein xP2-like [Cervus canadensis]